MGMFDYVNIDLAMLPLTEEQKIDLIDNDDFQTKSFDDRWMRTYDITPAIENGCQLFVTDNYTDDEKKFDTVVSRELEPVLLTGEIRFYTAGDSGKWYEFFATFDRGSLLKIGCVVIDDLA